MFAEIRSRLGGIPFGLHRVYHCTPHRISSESGEHSGQFSFGSSSASGGKTKVDELWSDHHLELHIGTVIQRDGYVYFSRGYNGPVLMTAVELKSGKIMWQERGFAKAQLLWADGKLILADQDGTLALCRATPQKFEVLAKASVLQSIAWTPPTLVGTRLYLRDRKTVAAYDFGEVETMKYLATVAAVAKQVSGALSARSPWGWFD